MGIEFECRKPLHSSMIGPLCCLQFAYVSLRLGFEYIYGLQVLGRLTPKNSFLDGCIKLLVSRVILIGCQIDQPRTLCFSGTLGSEQMQEVYVYFVYCSTSNIWYGFN